MNCEVKGCYILCHDYYCVFSGGFYLLNDRKWKLVSNCA
jgi:hypothetical protein